MLYNTPLFNTERYVEINEKYNSVELFIPLRPYTGIELDDSCKSGIAYSDFISNRNSIKNLIYIGFH